MGALLGLELLSRSELQSSHFHVDHEPFCATHCSLGGNLDSFFDLPFPGFFWLSLIVECEVTRRFSFQLYGD